jgi:hypothetical protein
VKKIFFLVLFLLITAIVFAYDYPETLAELLQQFADEEQTVHVVTNQSDDPHHVGIIRLVQKDYILFFEQGSLIILAIPSIVELYLE